VFDKYRRSFAGWHNSGRAAHGRLYLAARQGQFSGALNFWWRARDSEGIIRVAQMFGAHILVRLSTFLS
jgi:hypothetical protein